MLRSLAITCLDIALLAWAVHYRIEEGVAPGILVFASICAILSLVLEVSRFFYKNSKKRVALK